ncbi:Dhc-1 [Aphelenchoides besseyi]|nr:Dhc-1 [Aphelenchoides besseyi]
MPFGGANSHNVAFIATNESESPLIDMRSLIDHMTQVAGILFGESKLDLIKDPLDNAWSILENFIMDPKVPIFAIDQIVQHDNGSDEKSVVYTALIELQYRKGREMTIIFVKKNPMIVADTPIQNQVLVTAMDSGDPYRSILAHVGKVLAPFFKSVIRDQPPNKHERDKLVPAIQKSLNEFESNLLHLKQIIDIPDVELIIHPKILQAVEKAHARGTKPNVSDLGDDATDTSFLNALTTGVNRWTTDIQNVTAMDRDPDSGTSMQEVAFWLNLESALNKINQQREGEGVCLTLDVLNHAKRFHTTTSFEMNTALEEGILIAADYNSFLRDIPLNDLVSATDFELISKALSNVFNILKKVRNFNYPLSRIEALLSALSRDTTNQVQKVFPSQILLLIPMDEFEEIHKKYSEIITKWDTEYEKMTRLMGQRTRYEDFKAARLRSNHRHKDLEKRLEAIREFRRQHEQLSNLVHQAMAAIRSEK